MSVRSGSATAFWNATVVGAGNTPSNAVKLARSGEQLTIYITTSATATFTVEVAHAGALNSDGTNSDANDSTWAPLQYLLDPITVTITGAGSKALIIPDWSAAWVRLRTSAAATLTAGYELAGS